MNDEYDEITKLMSLKRFERPPESFTEDFLVEFHQRQRRELLQKSSVSLFWERLMTHFEGWTAPNWGLAGAAAMVLVAAVTWMKPAEESTAARPLDRSGMVPASFQQQDSLTIMPFIVGPPDESKSVNQAKNGESEGGDLKKPNAPETKPPFSAKPFIQGNQE